MERRPINGCAPHARRRIVLACALLCAIAGTAAAAPSWLTWTTEEGLPQNNVHDILQTRDGYLWLATLGGLVRYDGVRFDVFTTGNTNGIESSRFTKLFEDPEGSLWAVTETNGLTRYKDGVFTTYTTRDGLPHESVQPYTLRADARGGLAMKSFGGYVRWVDGRFVPFEPGEGEPFADTGHPANTGAVWHVEGTELVRVFEGVVTDRLPNDGFKALYDPDAGDAWIRTVFEDREGGFWFCSPDGRVRRYVGGQPVEYRMASEPRDIVQSICQDRSGTLWFGMTAGGLVRMRGGEITRITRADGLAGDGAGCVFEDAEGGLWIGATGLSKLREQVVTTYGEADGLTSSNVYSIYEDRKGTVWVGAWPGLTRYENGRFTPDQTPDGFAEVYVTSICEDRHGTLWMGTWGRGVKLLRDGRVTTLTPKDGLADDVVPAIYEDSRGVMWVGTRNGLTRYEAGVPRTYRVEDGLPSSIVSNIFEDRKGTLWIGTHRGLAAYRDGRFVDEGERWGLAGYLVRALHEDADGVLWVGTYDAGLFRIKDDRATRYTTREGLADNGAFRILEDDHGFFWISSNVGVYRVSRRELDDVAEGAAKSVTSISFSKADGMANPECNGGGLPAGLRTRDGRMWFPTQGGVAVFDPNAVELNSRVPPVLVVQLTLDGNHFPPLANLELPAGAENLEIDYTALSFVHPDKVRFRYRLEGLDTEWVDAGSRRTAYYPYIPPGTYRFQVVAANSDGVWNLEGASLALTVAPPFWRTWWFLALALVALVGAAVAAHRIRVAALTRKHRLQEAFSRELIRSQELERKRIAAELHDSLGQDLLVIKNHARLGLRLVGENAGAAEHLDEISFSSSRAIEGVREIAFDLHPYQLEHLGLGSSIETVLSRAERSSGVRFVARIGQIDDLVSKEEAINLYRIVQECVNNVLKHSGATEAVVTIRGEPRGVHLSIEDNGKGFAPDEVASSGERRGFGLMGIGERARMLGGACQIRSAPGHGTVISIDLVAGGNTNGANGGEPRDPDR